MFHPRCSLQVLYLTGDTYLGTYCTYDDGLACLSVQQTIPAVRSGLARDAGWQRCSGDETRRQDAENGDGAYGIQSSQTDTQVVALLLWTMDDGMACRLRAASVPLPGWPPRASRRMHGPSSGAALEAQGISAPAPGALGTGPVGRTAVPVDGWAPKGEWLQATPGSDRLPRLQRCRPSCMAEAKATAGHG